MYYIFYDSFQLKGDINMEKTFEARSKLAVFCNGKQISTYKFDRTKEINGYLIAYNSTSFTIYDSTGNSVLSKKLVIQSFYNNFFIVCKNGLYGVYRFDGTLIVPVEFNNINFYNQGIKVIKDNLCGLYSYDGTLIVPVEFDDIYFYDEGI